MRVTVTAAFCAALVAAHPGAQSNNHEALARRQARVARSLIPLEDTIESHMRRFPGDHDMDEVPKNLTYPGAPADLNSPWFGSWGEDPYWEGDFEVLSANVSRRADGDDVGVEVDPAVDEPIVEDVSARASRKKWGVAWTNECPKALAKINGEAAFGIYNWQCNKFPGFDQYGFRYFPMLHSEKKLDQWRKNMKRGYGKDFMLAPNEVNLKSQGYMTPGKAAWLIRTYMLPFLNRKAGDNGFKLIGPSCANGPSGIKWYDEFRKTDVWNSIDAISLHFYGLDAKKCIEWMKQWHDRYGKKIWLTEFGCHSFTGKGKCNRAQSEAFLKAVSNYCISQDWCVTYMIYGSYVNSKTGMGSGNAMFSSPTSLSGLGKLYVSA